VLDEYRRPGLERLAGRGRALVLGPAHEHDIGLERRQHARLARERARPVAQAAQPCARFAAAVDGAHQLAVGDGGEHGGVGEPGPAQPHHGDAHRLERARGFAARAGTFTRHENGRCHAIPLRPAHP